VDHRLAQFSDLDLDFCKLIVDPIEALIDLVESSIHFVEALVDARLELVEALVGPGLSWGHHHHDRSVTDCL
jgi:hypothetical protein